MSPQKTSKVPILVGVAIALLLLCCGGVLFGGFKIFQSAGKVTDEARPAAENAVTSLGEDWSAKTLDSLASARLYQSSGRDQAKAVLDMLAKKLGPIRSHGPLAFDSINASSTTESGSAVEVAFHCSAVFEKSNGTFEVIVVKENGAWKLLGFHVKSPALN